MRKDIISNLLHMHSNLTMMPARLTTLAKTYVG